MMKKSLVALAVVAVSGMAAAQSSVTVYGKADVYLGSIKTKVSPVGGPSTSLTQSVINGGGFNTSRFGLKGSEDLGSGLKANFVLESGFDLSTGASNNYTNPYTGATSNAVFGRQSWVGLSGNFGEVKLGKMWTPFDDVKGLGAAAFDANAFAPAANVWLSNNYNDRPGNAIYYSTPTVSGFSAAVMYSFGENKTTTTSAGKIAAFNVQYAGGPAAVALSYQTEKASGASTTTKYTQLNGSYDFGVAKLLAAYGHVKDYGFSIPATTFGPAISGNFDKVTEYQIGAEVPVSGPFTVSGGYARSKATVAGGGELKSRGFGLAAKYELSKRTFGYAGVQLAKLQYSGLGEVKLNTYGVGIQHNF